MGFLSGLFNTIIKTAEVANDIQTSLNEEEMFETEDECPQCGSFLMRAMDGSYDKCPDCDYYYKNDEFDDDDIPEGCAACGGPYPNCTDSCPLFDD